MSHPDLAFRVPRHHGPTVIPFIDMGGKERGHPNQPGLHGRYLTVDLDENNRHPIQFARERWEERHPDGPEFVAPLLGWGVCRQGFGLQDLPHMNEAEATAKAKEMNERTPVGPAGIRGAI